MFALKHDSKVFLCFDTVVIQMWPKAPKKKKENLFPSYVGHDKLEMNLPGDEGPAIILTDQCCFLFLISFSGF